MIERRDGKVKDDVDRNEKEKKAENRVIVILSAAYVPRGIKRMTKRKKKEKKGYTIAVSYTHLTLPTIYSV